MNEIHFAPLQGFTDDAYRIAHFQYVGNIDFYYTPYYSVDDSLTFKSEYFAEDLFHLTIPQILPGSMDELKVLLRFITENHFSTVNINLGCPYPMVTRKGRGAGLIQQPNLVSDMVQFINDHSKLKISLKTRSGLSDESEIFKLLEKISFEKLDCIIIHPRTAKQLYKGNASSVIFQQCRNLFPQYDLIYNGDIHSFEDFSKLKDQIKGQQKWMLGRGLLSNPLLGWQIKNNCPDLPNNIYEVIFNFSIQLIDKIECDSRDQGHALNRVKSQFFFLSKSFQGKQNIFRTIRKLKSLEDVKEFLNSESCKIISEED